MMIIRHRYLLLVILSILFVATIVQPTAAQTPEPTVEPDKSFTLAGEYSIEGGYVDGSSAYQRTIAIDRYNPIYTVTFADKNGTTTTTALALGNILVDAYGVPGCTEAAYTRHADGTLIGTWIDYNFDGLLALEMLIPAAKTTDFAGAYRIIGAYGNGMTYEGTVVISPGKDGLYSMKYHYPADATNPALDADALGIAVGTDRIGVVVQLAANTSLDKCSLNVAQFDPSGNFKAFVYEYGKYASEVGTRTK